MLWLFLWTDGYQNYFFMIFFSFFFRGKLWSACWTAACRLYSTTAWPAYSCLRSSPEPAAGDTWSATWSTDPDIFAAAPRPAAWLAAWLRPADRPASPLPVWTSTTPATHICRTDNCRTSDQCIRCNVGCPTRIRLRSAHHPSTPGRVWSTTRPAASSLFNPASLATNPDFGVWSAGREASPPSMDSPHPQLTGYNPQPQSVVPIGQQPQVFITAGGPPGSALAGGGFALGPPGRTLSIPGLYKYWQIILTIVRDICSYFVPKSHLHVRVGSHLQRVVSPVLARPYSWLPWSVVIMDILLQYSFLCRPHSWTKCSQLMLLEQRWFILIQCV